jgi:hypothetical protein
MLHTTPKLLLAVISHNQSVCQQSLMLSKLLPAVPYPSCFKLFQNLSELLLASKTFSKLLRAEPNNAQDAYNCAKYYPSHC